MRVVSAFRLQLWKAILTSAREPGKYDKLVKKTEVYQFRR